MAPGAAEIVLDAIGSLRRHARVGDGVLRLTRVENGLLDDIRFDRSGDLVGGSFVADRAITARSALLTD